MAKVLVVDDEAFIGCAFRRLLRRHGHDVAVADSGEGALGMLEDVQPDVVISDFRMPGMDGVSLLGEVKARLPRALRILLSGYVELEDVIRSIDLGEICRFIPKPWDPETLPRALAALLEQQRLLQELLTNRTAEVAVTDAPKAGPAPGVCISIQASPLRVAEAVALIRQLIGASPECSMPILSGVLERRGATLHFSATIGDRQSLTVRIPDDRPSDPPPPKR